MKPPVRIVPPTLPRPFGACASGEARGGKRALSDAEVALVTALEALKDVHAALVAAQQAVQSTVRSAQAVAMPAWTRVGSTSAGSDEADLVRAAQPILQDFFDNRDRKKIASSVAETALERQTSGSWAWSSSVTAQSSAERSLVGRDSGVWAWMSSDTAENADGVTESAVAAAGRLIIGWWRRANGEKSDSSTPAKKAFHPTALIFTKPVWNRLSS
jgi:hypothetical protein